MGGIADDLMLYRTNQLTRYATFVSILMRGSEIQIIFIMKKTRSLPSWFFTMSRNFTEGTFVLWHHRTAWITLAL